MRGVARALLTALFCAGPARAASEGAAAAPFLTLGLGPASHQAGASGPASVGAAGLDWNPAAAAVRRKEAYAAHQIMPQGVSFDALAATLPLRRGAALGLSVRTLIQSGIPQLDNSGAPEGEFGARDVAAAAAWARRFGRLRTGAALRVITQSVAGVSGESVAADAGLQLDLPRATLGAALANLGPGLRLGSQAAPLPATLRGGATWRFSDAARASIALEKARFSAPTASVGADYRVLEGTTFAIGYRAGAGGKGFGSLTAGIGVEIGSARIDVGYAPSSDLGGVLQVGLGYRFGPAQSAPAPPLTPYARPAAAPQPAQAGIAAPEPAPAAEPASAPAPAAPEERRRLSELDLPLPSRESGPIDRWSHDW